MFNGKNKAVTFSYDDGITQDQRLINLFNKYGLKSTFNLNSGHLGIADSLIRAGMTVSFVSPRENEIKKIYEGHEIAAHTVSHPRLTVLDEEKIIYEVEEDRKKLSELAGYEVVGMAYPCGGENCNQHVADVIRKNTGIKYARTIALSNSFAPQKDLYLFNPTIHTGSDFDAMFKLVEEFVSLDPTEPQLLYLWGHSFEFDMYNTWDKMEELCKMISGHKDIFYGTNKEVLL